MIKQFFRWVFSAELKKLEAQRVEADKWIETLKKNIATCKFVEKRFSDLIGSIDVSVDVYPVGINDKLRHYSRNWAVISVQGEKEDFIKFFDLGPAEIRHIKEFLKHFDKVKVDAAPGTSEFLKIKRFL